ncbi:MAG: hypothetical protein M3Z24_06180 [Chloroflexota bacterium]|nr:hypothetical protein [Chloroflexota bacterium]
MELSLRLDTLGIVEMHYLRNRERYRDWPSFELLAASRQARVLAYLNREVAEQLHQQILMVESAVGLDAEDDEDEDTELVFIDDMEDQGSSRQTERDTNTGTLSPAFAQALDQLNKLARQRLPEGGVGNPVGESSTLSGELPSRSETSTSESEEEDALEQLQDAFVQMMEVVRELAEELATDALKVTGRFRCARTNIEFIQAETDDEDEDEDESGIHLHEDDGVLELEVELVMVLQLFEEGHTKPDDLPAVELQLDVDDFERLHETLDVALEHERRSRRRK